MYETSHYTPWASCNFHLSGNVGNVWEWKDIMRGRRELQRGRREDPEEHP
jgi:hypothetical protein